MANMSGKRLSISTVSRINALHRELCALGETALEKAVEIGGLLAKEKRKVGHGEWLPWVEVSLDFGERQAQKYLTIYEHRDLLQIRTASSHLSINDACRLLLRNSAEPPPERVKSFPVIGTDAFRADVLKRLTRLLDHYPVTMHREVRRIVAAHCSEFQSYAPRHVADTDASTDATI
jgi:DUF3102 family protein